MPQIEYDCDSLGWYWRYVPSRLLWYGPYTRKADAEADALSHFASPKPMLIDKEIKIIIAPREDGGLRVWSDDLSGLVLSHRDQRLVLEDIGRAIIVLQSTRCRLSQWNRGSRFVVGQKLDDWLGRGFDARPLRTVLAVAASIVTFSIAAALTLFALIV